MFSIAIIYNNEKRIVIVIINLNDTFIRHSNMIALSVAYDWKTLCSGKFRLPLFTSRSAHWCLSISCTTWTALQWLSSTCRKREVALNRELKASRITLSECRGETQPPLHTASQESAGTVLAQPSLPFLILWWWECLKYWLIPQSHLLSTGEILSSKLELLFNTSLPGIQLFKVSIHCLHLEF